MEVHQHSQSKEDFMAMHTAMDDDEGSWSRGDTKQRMDESTQPQETNVLKKKNKTKKKKQNRKKNLLTNGEEQVVVNGLHANGVIHTAERTSSPVVSTRTQHTESDSPVLVSRDEGESSELEEHDQEEEEKKSDCSHSHISGTAIGVMDASRSATASKSQTERLRPTPHRQSKETRNHEQCYSTQQQSQPITNDWLMEWDEEMDDPLPDVGRFSKELPLLPSTTSSATPKRAKKKRKRVGNDVEIKEVAILKPQYAPHILNAVPENDPNKYYVEEESWKFHNPPLGGAVSPMELNPIPEPPPLPAFPNTGHCKWSFDPASRVVLAKFKGHHLARQDEQFVLSMMERDDITLISEGLVKGLNKELWTLSSIERSLGDEFYHKFRRFTRRTEFNNSKLSSNYMLKEVDKMLSMKVGDYMRYLALRRKQLLGQQASPPVSNGETDSSQFTFKDHEGIEHSMDPVENVLYMIDFDMVKLLPKLYKNLLDCFRLPSILPGGEHCLMNFLNRGGRPFMGPNLYVTPPGSFTHLHQDGHGTVDSGHFCMSGFNEVVMLRRLTERHKQNAQSVLNEGKSKFQALYNLPHGDHLGDKPHWPTVSAIRKCKEMGYCPSVFILRPGQLVHINKGRLHAFRKLTHEPLPEADCHFKLRQELHRTTPCSKEMLCVSVAWDWMYRGITTDGINREIVSMLECAELNRRNFQQSLAIPELCLLQMARKLAPAQDYTTPSKDDLDCKCSVQTSPRDHRFVPAIQEVLRGIYPGLKYIVSQQLEAIKKAEEREKERDNSGVMKHSTKIRGKPSAWEKSNEFTLDPYGAGDFFCKLCLKELSNVYLHCDGCEELLSKDFNICLQCHGEKRYKIYADMQPVDDRKLSVVHHTGDLVLNREKCSRKKGPLCHVCNLCSCCSCKCHTNFTMHFRFFRKQDEEELLNRVERVVGKEMPKYGDVTERLILAATGGIESESDHEEEPNQVDDEF